MHMQAVKLQTRVLPGNRIEVSSPDLREGADVEVVVMMAASTSESGRGRNRSMRAILHALPTGRSPRLFATWEDYDQFLRQEKESWDR